MAYILPYRNCNGKYSLRNLHLTAILAEHALVAENRDVIQFYYFMTLVGFLLRTTSFNQLSYMIKEGEFDSLFKSKTKVPRIDVIRNSLKSIDLSGLR